MPKNNLNKFTSFLTDTSFNRNGRNQTSSEKTSRASGVYLAICNVLYLCTIIRVLFFQLYLVFGLKTLNMFYDSLFNF